MFKCVRFVSTAAVESAVLRSGLGHSVRHSNTRSRRGKAWAPSRSARGPDGDRPATRQPDNQTTRQPDNQTTGQPDNQTTKLRQLTATASESENPQAKRAPFRAGLLLELTLARRPAKHHHSTAPNITSARRCTHTHRRNEYPLQLSWVFAEVCCAVWRARVVQLRPPAHCTTCMANNDHMHQDMKTHPSAQARSMKTTLTLAATGMHRGQGHRNTARGNGCTATFAR